MVAEMQLDNSWREYTSSKIPLNDKVYKYKGYKGPLIVNEYELQLEIMYNKKLPEPDPNNDVDPSKTKISYDELVRKCRSGDYQGTKDENKYFRVVIPMKRVIKGKISVKNKGRRAFITKKPDQIVWEPKKMYFKNFYQYLDYISLKNGHRPREEFFSSEKDFQNAYVSWEKKVNKSIHGFNGSNWNTYVDDNHGVTEYLSRCEEDERKHNEYVQNRRNELMKMKKVAQGDNDQENWTIASGRKCGKLTQNREITNNKKPVFNTHSISTKNVSQERPQSKPIFNTSSTSSIPTRDVSPERPLLSNFPPLVKVVN